MKKKNKGHEKKPNLFPKTLNIKKPFAFDFLIFRKARFKNYVIRSMKCKKILHFLNDVYMEHIEQSNPYYFAGVWDSIPSILASIKC